MERDAGWIGLGPGDGPRNDGHRRRPATASPRDRSDRYRIFPSGARLVASRYRRFPGSHAVAWGTTTCRPRSARALEPEAAASGLGTASSPPAARRRLAVRVPQPPRSLKTPPWCMQRRARAIARPAGRRLHLVPQLPRSPALEPAVVARGPPRCGARSETPPARVRRVASRSDGPLRTSRAARSGNAAVPSRDRYRVLPGGTP